MTSGVIMQTALAILHSCSTAAVGSWYRLRAFDTTTIIRGCRWVLWVHAHQSRREKKRVRGKPCGADVIFSLASSSHFLLSCSFSCTITSYRFISALILFLCWASRPLLSWQTLSQNNAYPFQFNSILAGTSPSPHTHVPAHAT